MKENKNNEPKTTERKKLEMVIFIGAKLKLNSNIKIKTRKNKDRKNIKEILLLLFRSLLLLLPELDDAHFVSLVRFFLALFSYCRFKYHPVITVSGCNSIIVVLINSIAASSIRMQVIHWIFLRIFAIIFYCIHFTHMHSATLQFFFIKFGKSTV